MAVALASPPSMVGAQMTRLIHWMFILVCIQLLGGFLEFMAFSVAAKRLTSRISVYLFRSIIQRNISYFDIEPVSHLNNKLFDDIGVINESIGFNLAAMLETLLCILCSLVVTFIANWKLTLIMLCILPLVFGGIYIFSKLTTRETVREMEAYSSAGQVAEEVFSSLRTVLSFNGGEFEKKRYENALIATEHIAVRKGAVYGVYIGWSFLVVTILYSIGFGFGLLLMHRDAHHQTTITNVLVVVSLFVQAIGSTGAIGPFLQSFSEGQGAIREIFRIIDETRETNISEQQIWEESDLDKESIDLKGDIVFNNVNFSYPVRPDVPILRDFNLVARAGETTALVGASGCGKSTCIALLLRFYDHSSGSITVNNQPIGIYNIRQLRRHIGLVNQEPVLFATSIYENISYGKTNATKTEVEEAAKQANAHDFIMRLPNKYATFVGDRGVQLSGGEKQRIALARVLIKRPNILLLDEATSALDNISEKHFQETLSQVSEGCTTIVVAHRLSTIQNAHRICVVSQGKVIEQGTHKTLMATEGSKYQEMFKSQMMTRMKEDTSGMMSSQETEGKNNEQMDRRFQGLGEPRSALEKQIKLRSANTQSIFMRLLYINRPEWSKIVFGCIACIGAGAMQPALSILLVKLILALKSCTYTSQLHGVLIFSLVVVLLGILSIVVRIFQFTTFTMVGAKLIKRVRARAFACLLRQEIAYFDQMENSVGALCNRLSSNALGLQKITGVRLGVVCETSATIIFALILGAFYNWQIMFIFVACLVTVFILLYAHVTIQKQLVAVSGSLSQQMTSLAHEVIHNMRTVKHLMIEKTVFKQYSALVQKSYELHRNYSVILAILAAAVWATIPFTNAILYWRVISLVRNGDMKTEEMIVVFAFATLFSQTVRMTWKTFDNMGASLSGAQSFFDLFDRPTAIDSSSTEGRKLANFRGEIEFDNVNFTYPSRPQSLTLDDFRLRIQPGQHVALVGTTGCGKSTVIQLLQRFYDVTHGQVRLDGVDIRELNIQWLRSSFGFVSQEPILFDLTIAENIAYAKENVPMEDIIEAAVKANVHQFIKQLPLGYQTRVGMKGTYLSGGEKQRIAIARAFLCRAKVLLLDEVTAAMDSYNEQIIREVIERTNQEDPNRTSLSIAHRLSTIRSCDLICVVDRGHVVESGKHTELLDQRGLYHAMLSKEAFE